MFRNREFTSNVYWGGLLLAWAYSCYAAQPLYNYSDRTLADLRTLLRDEDHQKRSCAAYFIGVRYRNPHVVMVGGPLIASNSPKPELPIPVRLVEELSNLLTNDNHSEVRTSALIALGRIKYYSDTSRIIEKALTDTNVFIRLSAAGELIEIHKSYNEPLATNVVNAILDCIDKSQDPEVLWISAFRLGCLGGEANRAIPWLERLAEHRDDYVRRRAIEALQKIRPRKSEKR